MRTALVLLAAVALSVFSFSAGRWHGKRLAGYDHAHARDEPDWRYTPLPIATREDDE